MPVPLPAIACALLLAGPAAAGEKGSGARAGVVKVTPGCRGTLSGAVRGTFDCRIDARVRGDRSMRIDLAAAKLPRGVKAFLPGDLDVPAPAGPGSYDLARLTSARVLLTDGRRRTYLADRAKAKGGAAAAAPRGELTLRIDAVKPGEGAPSGGHPGSAAELSGSLRARLVRADGKAGEVQLELTF